MNWSEERAGSGPGVDEAMFVELLVAAQRGDERAVERLFVELQPRLLRFLVAQEPRAADDLAGEVWLAVATRIAQFEGGWSDFRAWFFAIARHRLADYRRTAVRRRTDVVEAGVFETHAAADITEQLALDALGGQQAAQLISSVLHGDQAEVLLLRVPGDLDVDQVAGLMQRSPNWVRVTQHRAVRRLARSVKTKLVVMR